MDDETLSTAEAARLLSVGPSSVKRWADTGVLACIRTAGGHRRFRRADVEKFAGARPVDSTASADELANALLSARDVHRVLALLHDQRSQLGSWPRVAQAIGDALVVIGERWSDGEITVMAEHTASERLGRALSWLADTFPVSSSGPRYLLVAAGDDYHTLGLALAELCLRSYGWQGDLVGRMPPMPELVASLREQPPDLLGVSASLVSSSERALADLYRKLRSATEPLGVRLVLGGAGAWPERIPYGRRVRDFPAFAELLELNLLVRP